MNEVIRAAAELQSVCIAQDWRFCFIGGLALQRWGEPRETVDVDLTGSEALLAFRISTEHFVAHLLGRRSNCVESLRRPWPGLGRR